jgi:hypothetical protein
MLTGRSTGVNWIWTKDTARTARRALPQIAVLFSMSWPFASGARAEPARRPAGTGSGKPAAPIESRTAMHTFDAADETSVDQGARARARILFDEGVRAYDESRYYQAAEYFTAAHRAYPTPQLLFNVAKAYDKLGVQSSALAFYRDYLRHLPDAQDASEIGNRVHELEAALAQRGVQQLSVLTVPSRALLTIDGTAVGISPWTGETWPGAHRVTATLDGRKPLSTLITVEALRAQDYPFDLEPAPPPNVGASSLAVPPPAPPRAVSTLTWIVLGVGTAAIGTTLVVEMAQKNTTGLTRTGAFFGGVGLTASVLGGLLLHVDLHAPAVAPAQQKRALTASVSGRF